MEARVYCTIYRISLRIIIYYHCVRYPTVTTYYYLLSLRSLSDRVQHQLQRWSLINIPRKKKTKGNQKKKETYEKDWKNTNDIPVIQWLILESSSGKEDRQSFNGCPKSASPIYGSKRLLSWLSSHRDENNTPNYGQFMATRTFPRVFKVFHCNHPAPLER